MTVLTPTQLTTVRDTNGQYTNLYLTKFEPRILMQAQINDANIVKGAQVITFNNVITGSYTNLAAGQSVYIGSSQGGNDIGRVRLRSVTSTTLTVAVDDAIFYANGQYITVREFYEIWPVFPFASLNTGTLVPTIYKDWDITYSDQNVNFDPIIIMGPDFAGFYDTLTGNAFYGSNIFFSATGSYTVDGSTISSYSWNFPTACTITGSTSGTPGNVQFTAPGMYVVRCAVTASNGKTAVSYRHIALLNRHFGPIDSSVTSSYEEIADWEFGQISTDHINGAIANISVRNRADEFKDGDLVIIFREDYYSNMLQSFGGYPGRENILFVGYVDKADTTYDTFISKTDFILKGSAAYLQNKEMFSVQIQDTQGTPSDWRYIKNTTIQKALIHYVRWHSTLLNVKDFNKLTNTSQGDYHEDVILFQKGEILSNLTSFMQGKLFGFISSDRQGEFFTEIDLQMIVTGSRPASIMTFQEGDWLGDTKISEIVEQPVSNVLLGGVAYDPTTTYYITGVPLLSRAPGQWQTYVGKSQNVSGITLSSLGQTEINQISGLYYAKVNNESPDLQLDLSYNMLNIDMYPQSFYDFNISGTAVVYRGFNWKPKRLIPRKETIKLDKFVLRQIITFETETSGPPGDSVIIPTSVPNGDCTDCVPPKPCDCVTNPSCDGCPPPVGVGDKNTVYVVTQALIGRSRDFLNSSPTWSAVPTSGVSGIFRDFILDPWNPVNGAFLVTSTGIWMSTDLNSASTWTQILASGSGYPNWNTGGSVTIAQCFRIVATIQNQNLFYAMLSDGSSNVVIAVIQISGGIVTIYCNQTGIDAALGGSASVAFSISQNKGYQPIPYPNQANSSGNVYFGGLGKQLYVSGNGGVTFTPRAIQATTDFYAPLDIQVPYVYGSSDDGLIYVGGGRSSTTEAYILKSSSKFSTYGNNISPTTVHGSYPDGVGCEDGISKSNRNMVAHAQDGNKMYILGTQSRDSRGYEEPHLLYTSDAGATWTLKHSFVGTLGSGDGFVNCLGLWPYNENVVYVLGNQDGFNNGDGSILYSEDGGVTFIDKIGNWTTTFGAKTQPGWKDSPANVHNARVMIVPVWLAY